MYHLKDTATYLQNKKLILSLAVMAGAVFLLFVGSVIEEKIIDSAEQKARLYQTAIQAPNEKLFNYSIDTKQGNILSEVVIKEVDKVKFPEMNKEFPRVEKTKERYTRHERTVCETHYRTETRTRTVTDADGNTSTETYTVEVPYEVCHEETYYSWDRVDHWELSAKEVKMADRKYPIELFALSTDDIDAKEIINGQSGKYVIEEGDRMFNLDINIFDDANEGDIRYSYKVLHLPKAGTVFLNVTQTVRPVYGNKITLAPEKPVELVKSAQKSAETQGTVFKVIWGIFVVSLIIGGMYYVWFYEY